MQELIDAYKASSSVAQLVDRFGVDRTTVLLHLERAGVPRRPAVRKLTDDQIPDVAAYYRAGNSLASTGEHFGVNGATIARELRAAGVAIRPRRGE